MGKIRGFLLKHRVTKLFRRRPSPAGYHRLDPSPSPCPKTKPVSQLLKWARDVGTICCRSLMLGSGRIGQDPDKEKRVKVPKGHMAVYVGQENGDFKRVMVPVIYLNHPLFGELLREAEDEFGFDHPGGITIPCRAAEFERVRTRIKQGRATR